MLLTTAFTSLPMTAQTDTLKVDTTQVDEIEVYSDTTQNDSAVVPPTVVDDDDNFPFGSGGVGNTSSLPDVFDDFSPKVMGAAFLGVIIVCLIVFVVAPLAILGLILWFVHRNRKERMRLAEMAIQNGQPIPDEVATPLKAETNNEVWERGVRQTFLGIGLTAMGLWIGKLGIALGLLVLCIGVGNLFIARNGRRTPWSNDDKAEPDDSINQ